LLLMVRASLDLSLGVAFVGAARRSLAHDSRQRAWRPTSGVDERQRTLPLLVSFEGSGWDQQAERFDSYDYSRCRRVFSLCVVSSFHAFLIRVGCVAGHIRFGDLEFRLARSCVVPHEPLRTLCQVKVGWSQQGSWLAVLIRPILPLSHFSLVVNLFSKGRWSHSFCRRPSYVIATASVM